MSIVGYLNRWSFEPGDVAVVHADTTFDEFKVDLISLDDTSNEGPLLELGPFSGGRQHSSAGSMIYIPGWGPESVEVLNGGLWFWPTLARDADQTLLEWRDERKESGINISIGPDGRPRLRLTMDGSIHEVSVEVTLRGRVWYQLNFGVEAAPRRIWIELTDQVTGESHRSSRDFNCDASTLYLNGPITIGSSGSSLGSFQFSIDSAFDGKLEAPWLRIPAKGGKDSTGLGTPIPTQSALSARWDFSAIEGVSHVPDIGPSGLHGFTVNLPATQMKGHGWSWRQSASEQAENRSAIHFHHDDIGDLAWEPSASVTIPDGFQPGAYALRLRDDSGSFELPFFLSHKTGRSRRPRLAVVIPTFTYLAYGNFRPENIDRDATEVGEQTQAGMLCFDPLYPPDQLLQTRPDLGSSVYNRHADGSGICFASRSRPLVTFSSSYHWWGTGGPRHFASDLMLLRWLRRNGYEFDVVTDEDLDSVGRQRLVGYDVVITGSHPEYVSSGWLTALEDWLEEGGRLMYLGGNGLYWVTATSPFSPGTIEVRRGWAGSRDWESESGEEWLSFGGGQGGLWRHRGTPPQRLLGVGFTAMGWGSSAGYSRCSDSFRDEASFVFEGLADDEVVGGFDSELGHTLRGAAGDEIDRADFRLGTSPEAMILATSVGRHGYFIRAIEDVMQITPLLGNQTDPDVRADMVLTSTKSGGWVFSVGSMNWIPYLGATVERNNVSIVTRNVLDEFLGPK